jgi:hypothetical protein
LNAAVIVQAFKDLCKGNPLDWEDVIQWFNTPFFEEVCYCADVDMYEARRRANDLLDMPVRIRKDLYRKWRGLI